MNDNKFKRNIGIDTASKSGKDANEIKQQIIDSIKQSPDKFEKEILESSKGNNIRKNRSNAAAINNERIRGNQNKPLNNNDQNNANRINANRLNNANQGANHNRSRGMYNDKETNDEQLESGVPEEGATASAIEDLDNNNADEMDNLENDGYSDDGAEGEEAFDEEPSEENESESGSNGFRDKLKKLLKKLMKNPYFWLVVAIFIILIIIFLIILVFLYNMRPSTLDTILCGGGSDFDNVRVITVDPTETHPLDSYNYFYDYVKAVMYAEYAVEGSGLDDTHFLEMQASFEAFAIAASSYAVRRGNYYQPSYGRNKFENWCGNGEEFVYWDGQKVFRCPTNWGEDDIILIMIPSSNDQNACDIYNGCYVYDKPSSFGFKKNITIDFQSPVQLGEYTVVGSARKPVSHPELYEKIIERTMGVFIGDGNGNITGFSGYCSQQYKDGAVSTGCGPCNGSNGQRMCAGKNEKDTVNIKKQSLAGWGGLKILAYYYESATFISKSESGRLTCEQYNDLIDDAPSKLNWTDDDGDNDHVADENFDMNDFMENNNGLNSVKDFNKYLHDLAENSGIGTRMAAANVAGSYIMILNSMGVRGSYQWAGKYRSYGINPKMGQPTNATIHSQQEDEHTASMPISFDCTGFVDWAIFNGGVGSSSQYHYNVLKALPESIDYMDGEHTVVGEIGDIMHRGDYDVGKHVEGHVRIVIGHRFNSKDICTDNVVAESSNGIQVKAFDVNGYGGGQSYNQFGIVNMHSCYAGITCSKISDDDFYAGVDLDGET